MTRQTTDTDWITEGAKVAEHHAGRAGGNGAVYIDTIAGFARGYIVLANGRRYDRKTLLPHKANQGMSCSYFVLRPLTDPAVRLDLAAAEFKAVAELPRRLGFHGFDSVESVMLALDEIERAVRAARSAIVGASRAAEGNQHDA